MKKGISQNIFMYIMGLVILGMVFLIFFSMYDGLGEKKEILRIIEETNDIEKNIIKVEAEFDTKIYKDITLQSGIDKICFVDPKMKNAVLLSKDIDRYPNLKNNLQSNINDNVYLYQDNILKKSYEIHDFCISHYPHFFCSEKGKNGIPLSLTGLGHCTDLMIDWTDFNIDSDNVRKMSLYPGLFLIDDDASQKDKLRSLTLSLWRNNDGNITSNPFTIVNGVKINDSALTSIVADKGEDIAYYYNMGAGLTSSGTLHSISEIDYLTYWESYGTIVIVSTDNEPGWLISALFASNINAPLFFIDSSNIASYQPIIRGKTAYIIDYDTFDEDTIDILIVTLNPEGIIDDTYSEALRDSYDPELFGGVIGNPSVN